MNLSETKASYQSGEMDKQRYIQEMHKLYAHLFEYTDFIRDTDVARIEITDGTVVMTSRFAGVKMYCNIKDKRIQMVEALNFGRYERTEMDMVLRIIKPGFTVFDIGANIGWYSLHIAKVVPDVKIMAFEPLPETFDYLSRNVKLNEITNICLHNFGFSNEDKELVFYFCPDSSGSASAANIGERDDAQLVKCKVRRLDSFIAEQETKIDFIKCDVEGAELFVFQGGIESIKKYKPVIFTEMLRKWSAKFNYSPNEIVDLLSGIGYRCFTAQENKLVEFCRMDENTVETNFFFLHPEAHAGQIRTLVS